MATSFSPSIQDAIDRYSRALKGVRGLFDLYPQPRSQGAPPLKYRPLPPAIVQGITASFEGFAEELMVVALLLRGSTWAHVATNADMTNPSLAKLAERLHHATGIDSKPDSKWSLKLWKQGGVATRTGWSRTHRRTWSETVTDSESWMQVRHCLTHGLVTGTVPAIWPGPVTKKSAVAHQSIPTASAVLADNAKNSKRSLVLYGAVNCCLVYTEGAAVIAEAVAQSVGETVDTSKLKGFEDI